MPKTTKAEMILEHLKSGQTLTPLEALRKYGCYRLGARIYDLRGKNYNIKTRLIETEGGAHVAEYSLNLEPYAVDQIGERAACPPVPIG